MVPAASQRPPREYTSARTAPRAAGSTCRARSVRRTSHTRALRSCPPVATSTPHGEKAAANKWSRWPRRVETALPEPASSSSASHASPTRQRRRAVAVEVEAEDDEEDEDEEDKAEDEDEDEDEDECRFRW